MGILPLQFLSEEDPDVLCLKGDEIYEITGLPKLLQEKLANGREVKVRATSQEGHITEFEATVRIDTPQEILYYEHGGILQYVLRHLVTGRGKPEVVSAGMSTVADSATGSSVT
jgi:aconitate hydratase